MHDQSKLWVQMLNHKYLTNTSIFEAQCLASCSLIWKGILKAFMRLKDGFRWRLCDGTTTLWFDN